MKRIFITILTITLITGSISAQDDVSKFNTEKKIMLADALVASGSYYNAIDVYQLAYSDEASPENAYKLAYAYYLARDYKNAEKWFKTVTDTGKDIMPAGQFY